MKKWFYYILVFGLLLMGCDEPPTFNGEPCQLDYGNPVPTKWSALNPNVQQYRTATPIPDESTPTPYPTKNLPPCPTVTRPMGQGKAVYYKTPVPTPVAFVAGDVINKTLDFGGQQLQAVAYGFNRFAITWEKDNQIEVSYSGDEALWGNTRPIGEGQMADIDLSEENRLHLAYENNGKIYYMYSDDGEHPADVGVAEYIGDGTNPQVGLDQGLWSVVYYERSGVVYEAIQGGGGTWTETPVIAATMYDAEHNSNAVQLISAIQGNDLVIMRKEPWGAWTETHRSSAVGVGSGTIQGSPSIGWNKESAYVSWVTMDMDTSVTPPKYDAPQFQAANPSFPDAIMNADYIHEGMNAAVVSGLANQPFNAGLHQRIPVTPGVQVQASVMAKYYSSSSYRPGEVVSPGDVRISIGIDPTGGTNPHSPEIVWSSDGSHFGYTEHSVSTTAIYEKITVFLRGTTEDLKAVNRIHFDKVVVKQGGVDIVADGGFEVPFAGALNQASPNSWETYYSDYTQLQTYCSNLGDASSCTSVNPGSRNLYTVNMVWSSDIGMSFSSKETAITNRTLTEGVTGRIRPVTEPVITKLTEPNKVIIYYIYESGNVDDSSEIRLFGRPYAVICELYTTSCSDAPGIPVVSRLSTRPSENLAVAINKYRPRNGVIVWDALQTDIEKKDIYQSMLSIR